MVSLERFEEIQTEMKYFEKNEGPNLQKILQKKFLFMNNIILNPFLYKSFSIIILGIISKRNFFSTLFYIKSLNLILNILV